MSDINYLDNLRNVTREDNVKNMIEISFGGAIIKMCYRPPLKVSYQFDIHHRLQIALPCDIVRLKR